MNEKTVWIISDTHFHHAKIIEYCNRPFANMETMDEVLIEKWNSVVQHDDIVIHLGDFGFAQRGATAEYVKRLNGNIILIMGNHDRFSISNWETWGIKKALKGAWIWKEYDLGLSHYPPARVDDHLSAALYGHIHNNEISGAPRSFCFCVERINYQPQALVQTYRGSWETIVENLVKWETFEKLEGEF